MYNFPLLELSLCTSTLVWTSSPHLHYHYYFVKSYKQFQQLDIFLTLQKNLLLHFCKMLCLNKQTIWKWCDKIFFENIKRQGAGIEIITLEKFYIKVE